MQHFIAFDFSPPPPVTCPQKKKMEDQTPALNSDCIACILQQCDTATLCRALLVSRQWRTIVRNRRELLERLSPALRFCVVEDRAPLVCSVRCIPTSDADRLLTRVAVGTRAYSFSSAAQMIMLLGTRIDTQRSYFCHESRNFPVYTYQYGDFVRAVSRSRLPLRGQVKMCAEAMQPGQAYVLANYMRPGGNKGKRRHAGPVAKFLGVSSAARAYERHVEALAKQRQTVLEKRRNWWSRRRD